jgi:anti-sigma-K factor RskA
MNMELTHDEAELLLAAYALDAVDADEAEAIERHLLDCPRCRAEVATHREVAALLANTGASAPEGLWDRIVAGLDEPDLQPDAPPILSMLEARPGRSRRTTAAAMAAVAAVVAVAAAVIGVLGVKVDRLDRQVAQLRRPSGAQGVEEAALAALVDPAAHQVVLRPSASAPGASVTHVVILRDGRAFIVQPTLPPLAEGRTYQLWGVHGDQKISLGLLGRQPTTSAFRVDPTLTVLAITVEPEGGVVISQESPIVAGPVVTSS